MTKKIVIKKDGLKSITTLVDKNKISIKEITELSEIDHPLFSFRYLHDVSYSDCRDALFFIDFLKRLQKLSELGWNGIRASHRHGYGLEKIPISQLNARLKFLPAFITPEVKELDVFRATGDNRTFVGFQKSKIFYVFFIETRFGDVCPH